MVVCWHRSLSLINVSDEKGGVFSKHLLQSLTTAWVSCKNILGVLYVRLRNDVVPHEAFEGAKPVIVACIQILRSPARIHIIYVPYCISILSCRNQVQIRYWGRPILHQSLDLAVVCLRDLCIAHKGVTRTEWLPTLT